MFLGSSIFFICLVGHLLVGNCSGFPPLTSGLRYNPILMVRTVSLAVFLFCFVLSYKAVIRGQNGRKGRMRKVKGEARAAGWARLLFPILGIP